MKGDERRTRRHDDLSFNEPFCEILGPIDKIWKIHLDAPQTWKIKESLSIEHTSYDLFHYIVSPHDLQVSWLLVLLDVATVTIAYPNGL